MMDPAKNPPLKILFIVNEMHRTGAPIVVLDFIKWLKVVHKNTIIDILAIKIKGDLLDEFTTLSRKVMTFPSGNMRLRKKVTNLITGSTKSPFEDFARQIQLENYSHIYINSVHTLNSFARLQPYLPTAKKILHVHETEYLTEVFFGHTKQEHLLNEIDQFIAVSEHAKINLIKKYGVKEEKILVQFPFIEEKKDVNILDKISLRKKLGINESDFVIGCIGTPQAIKGTDLIPLITKKIKTKYPDFQFKYLSIGGNETNEATLLAKLDANKLQIEENILFLPHIEDVNSYLNLMDAYILTSREESFSLMTVKAVLNEIPIIMFKNNGGPIEIVDSDHSIVVEYLDLDEIANQIVQLKYNYEKAKNRSIKAKVNLENRIATMKPNEQIFSIL